MKRELKDFQEKHQISESSRIDTKDLSNEKLKDKNLWVCRTKSGSGPVIIMHNIDIDTDRHLIRRFYANTYDIDYYDVRECRMKYWLKHERKRYSTKK